MKEEARVARKKWFIFTMTWSREMSRILKVMEIGAFNMTCFANKRRMLEYRGRNGDKWRYCTRRHCYKRETGHIRRDNGMGLRWETRTGTESKQHMQVALISKRKAIFKATKQVTLPWLFKSKFRPTPGLKIDDQPKRRGSGRERRADVTDRTDRVRDGTETDRLGDRTKSDSDPGWREEGLWKRTTK